MAMQHSTMHVQPHQMLGSKKLSCPEEPKELNAWECRSAHWAC